MSNIVLLSDNEQEKFDKPPALPAEFRTTCFAITKELEIQIKRLYSKTNKVGFLLQYGFFKACKKFFTITQFNKSDLKYAANLLNIDMHEVDIKQYKNKIPTNHQGIILELLNYKPFDQSVLQWLTKEIKLVISQLSEPRHVFFQVLQKLHNQQIEIPSYHRLAELITTIYLEDEHLKLDIIRKHITKQQKEVINTLLVVEKGQQNLLNQLKYVNQSVKPKAIQASINLFKILKNYFIILLPIIETLELSTNTTTYYATWVKKSKLSQLKQFSQQNKIDLYVIAFIQHQFHMMQDSFVDILVKSVQSIKNTAIRNLNEIEQSTRTEKRNAVEYILKSHKTKGSLIDEITIIAKSPELTDSKKVKKIIALLDVQAKEKSEKERKKIEVFENSLERISKNNDYFATLEKLSVKLQNRVSSIIQVLMFNEENSDQNILKAIKYFVEKNGNIDKKAPMAFLKKDEREALTSNADQLRTSLYKILLFLHIVDAIKSGKLNLKYSYRYLAIQDYLIDNASWSELREELLKVSKLESFSNYEETINQLKNKLEEQYQQVNHSFLGQRNPYLIITQENKVQITTPPLEGKETKYIAALVSQAGYIPIFQVLYELNKITKYTQSFKHHSTKYNKRRPNPEVFIAGIIGLGCNIGISKIAQISTGINGNTLSNTVNWYFSHKTLMSANDNILDLIKKLSLSNIFVEDSFNMHGASDGCKVAVDTESLLANFSFKYFGHGKGISVYTFIDEQQALFHGLVMSASEREAHYVIDGLLENDVPRVKIHSTDTHGYSELIFATTYFMEILFAPRIKKLGDQHIYSFINKNTYERQGFKILPTRTINLSLIKQYWEDILRFMVTIKLKKVTASQLFKRLSSYAKDNPLYRAIKEFGRIIKSIFILNYYNDVKFRQRIEKHLSRIELANKFGHAVFYANEQEFKQAIPEEQEIVVLCRIFIQNAIILWNYLYLSQLLANCFNDEERNRMIDLMKNGSMLTWRHINLHGEFNFKPLHVNNNLFDINKILSLKLKKVSA